MQMFSLVQNAITVFYQRKISSADWNPSYVVSDTQGYPPPQATLSSVVTVGPVARVNVDPAYYYS